MLNSKSFAKDSPIKAKLKEVIDQNQALVPEVGKVFKEAKNGKAKAFSFFQPEPAKIMRAVGESYSKGKGKYYVRMHYLYWNI